MKNIKINKIASLFAISLMLLLASCEPIVDEQFFSFVSKRRQTTRNHNFHARRLVSDRQRGDQIADDGGGKAARLGSIDIENVSLAHDVSRLHLQPIAGLAPSDLDLAGLVAGLEKVEPIGEDEIAQDDSPSDDSSDREETATNSELPIDPKPRPTRKRRSRGLLSRELSSLND